MIEKKAKRRFRFELIWSGEKVCEDVVRSNWRTDKKGYHGFKLMRKLSFCSQGLIEWSKKYFLNSAKEIEEITARIEVLQKEEASEENRMKIEELKEKLEKAWVREEQFWYQRARIIWLMCGDRNTRFFHQRVLLRRQRNKITRLKGENGEWLQEEDKVASRIGSYFQKLFTSEGEREWGRTMEAAKQVVTGEMNQGLVAEVQDEEIKRAVFQMGALKAPGPDDYNGLFYQKY